MNVEYDNYDTYREKALLCTPMTSSQKIDLIKHISDMSSKLNSHDREQFELDICDRLEISGQTCSYDNSTKIIVKY